MRFDRRRKKLERGHVTEPTTLYFADGRTAIINGPGDYLLRLLNRAVNGAQTPQEEKELHLSRTSVDAKEPGDGRMVELVRCFLLGPAEA